MCACDQQMGQIPASEFDVYYMPDPFPIFEPGPVQATGNPLAESPVRPRREIIVHPEIVLPSYFENSEHSKGLGIIPIAVIGLVLLALFKGGR